MGVRRVFAVAVVAGIVVAGLASCSVPVGYGVRLNADGTVDFVECTTRSFDFVVDYTRTATSPESDPVEWEVVADYSDFRHEEPPVIFYGEPPDGYTTVSLLEPAEDWLYVEFAGLHAYRGDLPEGEWVWQNTSRYPWEPEHPCDGLDPDELER